VSYPVHSPVVTREGKNRLTRHLWIFEEAEGGFRLAWYGYQKRASLKHPWTITKNWDRSGSQYGDAVWLTVDQVPWSPEVQQDTFAAILEQIKIEGPAIDSEPDQIQGTEMPET
jgi:hypothetical protein